MLLNQAAITALFALLGSFWALHPNFGAAALECSTPEGDPLRMSMTSLRNRTGHWLSEAVMHSASNGRQMQSGSSGGGTWEVDVQLDTKSCGRVNSTMDMKLTFTLSPPKPGADYELFPGIGYFKFHSKPQTWAKAREICEQEWAHLAIVNSVKEADFIAKQLFGRFPKIEGAAHQDWAWIGLEKDGTTGGWVTIFGEPLNSTGYTKWHSGRPVSGYNLDCVLIQKIEANLFDNPCSLVDAFICERELLQGDI